MGPNSPLAKGKIDDNIKTMMMTMMMIRLNIKIFISQ